MATGSMTAVVFGGGGFIGRHLVRRLGKAGMVVRVPSRHPTRLSFLRTAGVVGQIVPELVGPLDDEELAATIQRADIVINLIGILAENSRNSFDRVHAKLPGRIAAAAATAGVKHLVHVSAIGADAHSASAYARSKAAGEEAVRAAFPQATIVRPSIVFGPEDGFFNRFARMAVLSPALPLIGGGKTLFQPVFVGDVAKAFARILADPAADGQTYELGGPARFSFRELLEMTLREIHRRRALVPIPFPLAGLMGSAGDVAASLGLPPPLTSDQVTLLKADNVVSGVYPGLADLGVTPTTLEAVLPLYLYRYRKGGQFADQEERIVPA